MNIEESREAPTPDTGAQEQSGQACSHYLGSQRHSLQDESFAGWGLIRGLATVLHVSAEVARARTFPLDLVDEVRSTTLQPISAH